MKILDWRNRDADVQIDLQFRKSEDDPDNNTTRIAVSDGQCNNARWDDADQTKEPSRHVEITMYIFGFRLEITVCTILRPARDTESRARSANYHLSL